MVRRGMALNLNGAWEERKLSPELQKIIRRYSEKFNVQAIMIRRGFDCGATKFGEQLNCDLR